MAEADGNGAEPGLVLSLGSINADFQVRIRRRPDVSETLLGDDFERFAGGKAANVAFLARRLGLPARLFGHVGGDDLAEQALGSLRNIGVDLSGVKAVADADTGVAMITVPPDGKKGIVLAANANEAWTAEDVAEVAREIDHVLANAVLVVDCEIPVFVVEQAVSAASRRGCMVVLDPSPAERVTDALIAAADLIVPNASEAEQIAGIECIDADSAARAGTRLLERGAKIACVKLPDGGCILMEKERLTRIGAVPVEVTDTTGAGDAFAGALAVALAEQQPLAEAARFAVAAAHVAVTGYGSQSSFPTREQIHQMLTRLDVRIDAPDRNPQDS